ncbi:hypothetical protein [Lentzea jiangxiensis]|uniref:Lipocalin-like domain-containing protein n=1 Tax=Lentzea jiangxiensis TaxID=641025 RepID=A0A1H0X7D2_9PSEU|nr:hypothetical protein [Lentzea jiangxiensis]SDP98847.1 hypothetical protein SAMN05421507_14413 [Lentzea jiangxiensis]
MNGDELRLAELAGAWSLTSITAVGPRGTAVLEHPLVEGLLTYASSGHMSVVVQAPEGLYGCALVACAGRVTIDGDRLVHHVTVGAEPTGAGAALTGTASPVRSAAMTLTLIGRINDTTTIMTWRRNPPLATPVQARRSGIRRLRSDYLPR